MTTNETKKTLPETVDVAIIGGGGGGITAALTVANGGAKVAVFEKDSQAGGTMRLAEGTFAVESKMQWRKNIKETRDETFHRSMEFSHWRANAALVRAIIDKSADTIEWLEGQGVKFIEPLAYTPGGPRTWHIFEGYGAAVVDTLVGNLVKKGVNIYYNTAGKELYRDENGRIAGVIVEDKSGNQTRINARAVIIATGGYANNKEWIKKYTGLELGESLMPLDFNKDGDGIRMAWEAGAAEEGIGVVHVSNGYVGIDPKNQINAANRQPTLLWVNKHGVRFCDESIVQSMPYAGNAMLNQPGGYVFRIFDEEQKRNWIKEGGLGLGMYVPPLTPLKNLDIDINTALEDKSSFVIVADTLEELAQNMGVDYGVFKKTVDDYNSFCEKGYDEQFAKERRYLQPLRTPRFYAIRVYNSFLGTLGGIRINEKAEVLDKHDLAIPGLYAVGNDAGGLYGDSYDKYSPGITSAFAINSGRIAAENALKRIVQS